MHQSKALSLHKNDIQSMMIVSVVVLKLNHIGFIFVDPGVKINNICYSDLLPVIMPALQSLAISSFSILSVQESL